MSVNYLIEIIRMDEWEFSHPISANAYKMWHKLLSIANMQRFPEWIKIPNARLTAMVGCTECTLAAARLTLIQEGLIEYKKKGKGKGATCWYRINYFSLNPDYSHKNYGNNDSENEGISNGENEGINNGITPGLNKTKDTMGKPIDDEDDYTPDTCGIPKEERTIVNPPLHYPVPVQPTEGVNGRGRDDKAVLYPPRNRRLDNIEQAVYDGLVRALTYPDWLKLFGNHAALLLQIMGSDRFPLELVAEALQRTVERDKKYSNPLVNPVAYTMKLLEDWESRGFRTVKDIKEAKDDYWSDY